MSADLAAGVPDPTAVRRVNDRAAGGFDEAAVVVARAREELLDRFDLLTIEPARILDVGTGTGEAAQALARRFPKADVLAVDIAPEMLRLAGRRRGWLRRRFRLAEADAARLPADDGTVDLVFCNLVLPQLTDPVAALAEFARVTAPGGLFVFSACGPDTLIELARAWATVDTGPHVLPFTDMHDLGDAVVRAGFESPVLDTERLTLTYASPGALMRELRAQGATNTCRGRRRSLTGPGRLRAVEAAYPRDADGRIAASVELVYGHAWRAAARPGVGGPAETGVTRVSPDQIGRRRD